MKHKVGDLDTHIPINQMSWYRMPACRFSCSMTLWHTSVLRLLLCGCSYLLYIHGLIGHYQLVLQFGITSLHVLRFMHSHHEALQWVKQTWTVLLAQKRFQPSTVERFRRQGHFSCVPSRNAPPSPRRDMAAAHGSAAHGSAATWRRMGFDHDAPSGRFRVAREWQGHSSGLGRTLDWTGLGWKVRMVGLCHVQSIYRWVFAYTRFLSQRLWGKRSKYLSGKSVCSSAKAQDKSIHLWEMYFHNEKQREADFKKHVECKLCSTKQLVEKPDPRGSWMDSRGRRASSVVPMRPSTGRFWMHLAGGCSVAWMTGHSGRESPENRLNWIYIYTYR